MTIANPPEDTSVVPEAKLGGRLYLAIRFVEPSGEVQNTADTTQARRIDRDRDGTTGTGEGGAGDVEASENIGLLETRRVDHIDIRSKRKRNRRNPIQLDSKISLCLLPCPRSTDDFTYRAFLQRAGVPIRLIGCNVSNAINVFLQHTDILEARGYIQDSK